MKFNAEKQRSGGSLSLLLCFSALGIFGIINKPSIRKCLKRIPKYIKFSLDYFSEFALIIEETPRAGRAIK
jgi:hypothetical protein